MISSVLNTIQCVFRTSVKDVEIGPINYKYSHAIGSRIFFISWPVVSNNKCIWFYDVWIAIWIVSNIFQVLLEDMLLEEAAAIVLVEVVMLREVVEDAQHRVAEAEVEVEAEAEVIFINLTLWNDPLNFSTPWLCWS